MAVKSTNPHESTLYRRKSIPSHSMEMAGPPGSFLHGEFTTFVVPNFPQPQQTHAEAGSEKHNQQMREERATFTIYTYLRREGTKASLRKNGCPFFTRLKGVLKPKRAPLRNSLLLDGLKDLAYKIK